MTEHVSPPDDGRIGAARPRSRVLFALRLMLAALLASALAGGASYALRTLHY
jgi:hypothetical protein